MLHIIEVGAEVNIDDSRLLFDDGRAYPAHRLMWRPFRSVSIRSRLEIGFKDRLQDQLECPLDHTLTDRRNRQDADLSPVLSSMASNVIPSIPGAPLLLFAIR